MSNTKPGPHGPDCECDADALPTQLHMSMDIASVIDCLMEDAPPMTDDQRAKVRLSVAFTSLAMAMLPERAIHRILLECQKLVEQSLARQAQEQGN